MAFKGDYFTNFTNEAQHYSNVDLKWLLKCAGFINRVFCKLN